MNILSMAFIVGLLTATVRMMVPILLSALGETYSERAGILNKMCIRDRQWPICRWLKAL